MLYLTTKINKLLYSYDPKEFLPIYAGNELINKPSFVAYKAKRAGRRILSTGFRILSVLIVGFFTAATPINER